jgi:hypothetical protein
MVTSQLREVVLTSARYGSLSCVGVSGRPQLLQISKIHCQKVRFLGIMGHRI